MELEADSVAKRIPFGTRALHGILTFDSPNSPPSKCHAIDVGMADKIARFATSCAAALYKFDLSVKVSVQHEGMSLEFTICNSNSRLNGAMSG